MQGPRGCLCPGSEPAGLSDRFDFGGCLTSFRHPFFIRTAIRELFRIRCAQRVKDVSGNPCACVCGAEAPSRAGAFSCGRVRDGWNDGRTGRTADRRIGGSGGRAGRTVRRVAERCPEVVRGRGAGCGIGLRSVRVRTAWPDRGTGTAMPRRADYGAGCGERADCGAEDDMGHCGAGGRIVG